MICFLPFTALRWPLCAMVALLLAGCATSSYQYSDKRIDRAVRQYIVSLDTYLAVAQKEIHGEIVKSQAAVLMGGGLIPALIDVSVDSKSTRRAESAIQPIRDNLLDFDFAEYLRAEINRSLVEINWLNAREVILEREADPERYTTDFEKSNAAAVLFVNVDYKLSPKLDFLQTRADLIMFPKDTRLYAFRDNTVTNKADNPVEQEDSIYRKEIAISKPLGTAGLEVTKAAEELAKHESRVVREALKESAQDIAARIAKSIRRL